MSTVTQARLTCPLYGRTPIAYGSTVCSGCRAEIGYDLGARTIPANSARALAKLVAVSAKGADLAVRAPWPFGTLAMRDHAQAAAKEAIFRHQRETRIGRRLVRRHLAGEPSIVSFIRKGQRSDMAFPVPSDLVPDRDRCSPSS